MKRPSSRPRPLGKLRLALAATLLTALITTGCMGIQEAEGWAAPVDVDGRILVQSSRGQLSLVDPNTGSVAWQYPNDDDSSAPFYATPVVNGAQVYVATLQGRVSRIQAAANAPIEDWSLQLEGRVIATPLLSGGELFVPTERGSIAVIEADTGRLIRSIETAERRMWGSPAATSGTLFVGDLDNRATAALDLSTGQLVWEQAISGATAADLTLDGDLLLVGSFDQSLHALDVTRNGEERWAFRGTGWFMGRPLVDANVIYAATMKGSVYAIDRDTGTAIWSISLEDAEFRASPVIVAGQLIAIARNGHVYALSLTDGAVQWDQRVNSDGFLNANVLVLGAELYAVTSKQDLVRVDLARGGAFQAVPLSTNR